MVLRWPAGASEKCGGLEGFCRQSLLTSVSSAVMKRCHSAELGRKIISASHLQVSDQPERSTQTFWDQSLQSSHHMISHVRLAQEVETGESCCWGDRWGLISGLHCGVNRNLLTSQPTSRPLYIRSLRRSPGSWRSAAGDVTRGPLSSMETINRGLLKYRPIHWNLFIC